MKRVLMAVLAAGFITVSAGIVLIMNPPPPRPVDWNQVLPPPVIIRNVHIVNLKDGSSSGLLDIRMELEKVVETGTGLPPRPAEWAKEAKNPKPAMIVDGAGGYVIPSLWDMHTHIATEKDLGLLVAHGVTLIRNMGELPWWGRALGFDNVGELQNKVDHEGFTGPRILRSSPVFDGDPPVSPFNRALTDPAGAAGEVQAVKDWASHIKVYDNLSPEVFASISAETRKMWGPYPLVGHFPKAAPETEEYIAMMDSIEHLSLFMDNDKAALRVPEDQLAPLAATVTRLGVWNCPTLVIWKNLPPKGGIDALEGRPQMRHVHRGLRFIWGRTLARVYENEFKGEDYAGHMRELSRKVMAALKGAGAPLLAGTDMNFPGVFPGVSIHEEMEAMVEAGLSPLDALRAATRNPRLYVYRGGKEAEVGPGYDLDLILLEKNPLEDIRNTRLIMGLSLRGQWLDRQALERLREG